MPWCPAPTWRSPVLLRSRPARALVVLAVLCLAAACGDDDDGGTATTDAQSTESSTTTTAEAGTGAATVELDRVRSGRDPHQRGQTLYVFTPDDGGAPTCNDDCATSWPPLVADGAPTVGEGLDDALFATATRDDGTSR